MHEQIDPALSSRLHGREIWQDVSTSSPLHPVPCILHLLRDSAESSPVFRIDSRSASGHLTVRAILPGGKSRAVALINVLIEEN